MYISNFFRLIVSIVLLAIFYSPSHANLIDDPDGIFGTLHIDGSPDNSFTNSPVLIGPGADFVFTNNDFEVEVDIMDQILWTTQTQLTSNTLPWEIWLEDLEWGVPGRITGILVPMQPPFMTTFTSNSIHITYLPAQQNPPGPGTTLMYHTDFTVQHVPEPATAALLLLGFGLTRVYKRRQIR